MVPPMKFRASPLPVNMCVATEMEDDICKDFKKNCMQIPHCRGKLYHRFEQKRSGVRVEVVWSTPSPTPIHGSLPRLRATPAPTLASLNCNARLLRHHLEIEL